ncbi:LOW QUALITY PROTEIN: hypothetical protein BKA57DRAFT_479874 [Linnemannia elongata]|nr:LOW QUALITY PROTEIN: hypothetical protein BKA57DRAFT_479874 [Linnemannia elongata]
MTIMSCTTTHGKKHALIQMQHLRNHLSLLILLMYSHALFFSSISLSIHFLLSLCFYFHNSITKVAEGDAVEVLQEELTTLSRRARSAIQGKITSKKISTWLKGGTVIMRTTPDSTSLLHDEEGYLSDLSTTSNDNEIENEGIVIMAADDSTLRDNTSRESAASRRLMRRAISLEDLNTVSAIHHHNHHHILNHDSPPERPSSTMSMSLPVPSDTLPSLQPDDRTLYHRYYHHRSLERPPASNYSALLNDDNQYSLYRLDHDHQGPVRTMSPDADMDDLALLDDVKSTRSTYTTNPVLQEDGKDQTVAAPGGSLGWLNASPLLEALVNWVEGPPNRPQPKKNLNEKPNPILEIPFQFIALLTYPEPDPKTGDKMSLAMVRETAFVRQRRKTLMMLTAYTLINSGRMNVNMAKRAVGQRVGWAKQWAGGFFKRGQRWSYNIECQLQQVITQHFPHACRVDPDGRVDIAGEKADSAQENSPQIKRRGLFGKRKTYTTSLAPSQRIGASTSSIVSPTSVTGEGLVGDDVSVMTATTTILTNKNGTPLLSTSPQPQNQSSLSQLDLVLPMRPSALRKEFSVNGNNNTNLGVALDLCPLRPRLVQQEPRQSTRPQHRLDPLRPTRLRQSLPLLIAMQRQRRQRRRRRQDGRRSYPVSHPLQPRKQQQQQQQQNSAISPVTPTFPPLIVAANASTTMTAAGPRTGFLTGSLSTSKLSNVLGGGGGSNRSNDAGTSHGGGVYEEEERLEYQLYQHNQHPQFNPHRRASTTSTYSAFAFAHRGVVVSGEHHHQHPFAVSGQDHFQQQLSPHQQGFHPMWQIGSVAGPGGGSVTGGVVVGVGVRSGSASGDGLMLAKEEFMEGGGLMVKEDLLDPVTSAVADAMEGFDREA